jgi:predicted enzyme related to lactoylglutathione lyase
MAKILGLGGLFFKSDNPKALCDWYRKWLNLSVAAEFDGVVFMPDALPPGAHTIWSPFEASTKYMDPSKKDFMMNFIVDDVDGALEQAEAGGAKRVDQPQDTEFGRFGWFIDPDGNKIELWKPAPAS